MKRNSFILACLVLVVFFSQSWAVCPEDPNDSGECDTVYIECYPGDEEFYPPGPHLVRFPFYVTHDIVNPLTDSIAGIVFAMCFNSTNPEADVIAEWDNNRCGSQDLFPSPDLNHSVFRHLPSMEDPQERNWMMDLSTQGMGWEWDTRMLNLSMGDNFWFCTVATGTADQKLGGGSRVLLLTMTLTVYDSTTVCIDSCFWPPDGRNFIFTRSDAQTYVPRHFLPLCQPINWSGPPTFFIECPPDEEHSEEGIHQSGLFEAYDLDGVVEEVSANYDGGGIEIQNVVYTVPPPAQTVQGYVTYHVFDHCNSSGGMFSLTALNDAGQKPRCNFSITLFNNPPIFNLPGSWRTLAGYNMILHVPASDMDGDAVDEITLDGFWYEPDSLQPPINPPSFDGGNPGLFTWLPTETETGDWICSFIASDACGAEVVHQMTISVGSLFCGDCNNDEIINLGDLVFLVGYLYRGGIPPDPLCKGDVNSDGSRDISDLVLLINYLFRGGLAPYFDCCSGS